MNLLSVFAGDRLRGCALACVIIAGGCRSRQRTLDFPDFEAHGFSLRLEHVAAYASHNAIDHAIYRAVVARGVLADLTDDRIVAVGRYMVFDELRDQSGRDLIAIAEPYIVDYSKNDISTYWGFEQWGFPYRNRRRQSQVITICRSLPEMVTGISVARGHAICLIATDIRRREFELAPTEDWVELAPGMQFRIDAVEPEGRSTVLRYATREEPNEKFPKDAQQIRWFRIEQLDGSGEVLAKGSALGERVGDGLRSGNVQLNRLGENGPVTRIRVSIIEDFDTLHVPFDFRDVSLR